MLMLVYRLGCRRPLKTQLTALVVLSIFMASCTFTFGTPFPNTPKGNYDYFFYDLSQTYAYHDSKFENGLSMSEIKAAEKNTVGDTWRSLADALDRVVNVHIRDFHLYSVYSPVVVSDISSDPLLQAETGRTYDVRRPFITGNTMIQWISTSRFLFYGVVQRDTTIGYIYVDKLVDQVGGSVRLGESESAYFGSLTDTIVREFSARGVEKIIFDIRSEAGGAVQRGKEIASRFVGSEKTFMISEVLVGPSQFKTVHEKISPKGASHFRNAPLVVLTNTLTCSAGEMLVLMLQHAEGYKATIGTETLGCTGTVIDRELPNGWIFRMTTSKTHTSDGTSYFKVGIKPTRVVSYGTNDDILQAAIDELQ